MKKNINKNNDFVDATMYAFTSIRNHNKRVSRKRLIKGVLIFIGDSIAIAIIYTLLKSFM